MIQSEDWFSEKEAGIQRKGGVARAIVIATTSILLISGIGLYLVFEFVSNSVTGSSGLCRNQVITREAQPDGKYEFVVFKRDCGATTAYSYQLSVKEKDEELQNTKGNIFISNQEFQAKWISSDKIRISGPTYEIFKQERNYKGINIVYSDTP
ncbi:DUF5412 family protein [Paenibacillus sp. MCAF20]